LLMPTVDDRGFHNPCEERRLLDRLDQVLLDLQVLSQRQTILISQELVSHVLDRNDGLTDGRHRGKYNAPDDAGWYNGQN